MPLDTASQSGTTLRGSPVKKTAVIVLLFLIYPLTLHAVNYYAAGRHAYINKNYDKAREYLKKAVEQSDLGDAWYFLGEIEKIEGNYKEAEEYFSEASTKRVTSKYLQNTFWNLMVLAEQRGDYEAMALYAKRGWERLKFTPLTKKVHDMVNKLLWTDNSEAITLYRQGGRLKSQGDTEGARKAYNDALSKDSNFLAAHFELALIYYNNENYRDAERHISPVVSGIPFYSDAAVLAGDIYLKQSRYRKAREEITHALDYGFFGTSTEYMLLMKRGAASLKLKDMDAASEDFEKARQLRPQDIQPLRYLAAIYMNQKKYDEALTTLHRVERLKPSDPSLIYQIGSIYYHQEDPKHTAYFDRLFRIIKNNDEQMRQYHRGMMLLAETRYEREQYNLAEEILRALPDDMKDYDAHAMLAKSCYYQKKYNCAWETFAKVSPKGDDRILQAKAGILSGRKSEAAALVESLASSSSMREKLEKESLLKPLLPKKEEPPSDPEPEPEPEPEEPQDTSPEKEETPSATQESSDTTSNNSGTTSP